MDTPDLLGNVKADVLTVASDPVKTCENVNQCKSSRDASIRELRELTTPDEPDNKAKVSGDEQKNESKNDQKSDQKKKSSAKNKVADRHEKIKEKINEKYPEKGKKNSKKK